MNDQSITRNWAEPPRFALLLALMVFIPFWNVLLGFDVFVTRDFGLFSFPVATFHKECFWHGTLPSWNPYDCCGVPFLAQFNTLALYPLSLIYLLLPLTWSLPAFCLFHVYFGGMGMYFLARRWTGSQAAGALAGVLFAFNGLSLNFLIWPSHIATFSWVPWVIFLVEDGWRTGGTRIIAGALAGGMQILGGGPETIGFTWLILFALAAVECAGRPRTFWTTSRRLAVMGSLALGLAAAQLLPTIDFARHSHRGLNYGRSDWAMPVLGAGNFLVPMFHTIPMQTTVAQPGQYWTTSYYAGIGAVFLAGLAVWRGLREPRVWLPAAFLLGSLVLALGYNGYVFLWLQRLIPGFGMFQFPIKFVLVTLTVAPLLAACGLAQYEKPAGESRAGWRVETAWGALMLGLICVIIWVAKRWPVEGGSWQAAAANGFWRAVFLVLTVLAVYVFAKRPAWRGWSIVPLLALGWLDVLTHEPWQNPVVEPGVYQQGLAAMDAKFEPKPSLGESRVMSSSFAAGQLYYHPPTDPKTAFLQDRAVFLADCNLLDDLPKVDGFFSLNLHESDGVLRLISSRTGRNLDSLEDLLSVSRTTVPGRIFDWEARTNYIPIVSAGQAPVFAEDAAAFDAIDKNTGDFRSSVYLTEDAKASVRAVREPRASVVAKDFTPGRESFEVETPADTMAVLSQAYYHNWKASVDGKSVPLWRANYAFQAVEAPAGKHLILLEYKDNALRIGGAISIACLLGCGLAWLLLKQKTAAQKSGLFSATS
ncbi:MAG TPA: YfhO family protein [Verrucomicrobiae bacterium]|jgi:hypothetical protein